MRPKKKCLLAILLGIALLLPYIAVAPTTASADPVPYLVLGTVGFYGDTSFSSAKMGELHKGDIFSVTGSISSGGTIWYLTYASVKDADGSSVYTQGYVPNQNVRIFTAAEQDAYIKNGTKPNPDSKVSGSPTAAPADSANNSTGSSGTTASGGTVQVNLASGRANIRAQADPGATVVDKVVSGTLLAVRGSRTGTDGVLWYYVYNVSTNKTGYIRSDLVRASSASAGSSANNNTAANNANKITNYTCAVFELTYSAATMYMDASTLSGTIFSLVEYGSNKIYLANLYAPKMGDDGYTWYKVSYSGSISGVDTSGAQVGTQTNTYVGYVRGDLLKPQGTTTATAPPSAGGVGALPNGQRYVVSSNGAANMRSGAGTGYSIIAKIPSGTTVAETNNQRGSDGLVWRYVSTGVYAGWIRSDYLTAIYTPATEPPAGPTPTPSPTPVPIPASGYVIALNEAVGYNTVSGNNGGQSPIVGSVIFRMQTGQTASVLDVVTVDTNYQHTTTGDDGTEKTETITNRFYFYKVSFSGTVGYVHSQDVRIPLSNEIPAPVATPVTTLPPQYAGSYVVALKEATGLVRFSDNASGYYFKLMTGQLAKIYQVAPKGTKFVLTENDELKEYVTDQIWYQVLFANAYGWVPENSVRVMTANEVAELGLTTPPPGATPTPTPGPIVTARPYQVKIGISNVALRTGPAMSTAAIKTLSPSTICQYVNQVLGTDGYVWYQVTHYSSTGFVRSDLAILVYSDGTTSQGSNSTPNNTTPSGAIGSLMAVVSGETNLRSGMGLNFGVVAKLNRGEIMQITGSGIGTDYNTWYAVTSRLSGTKGYVRSDLLRALTASEQAANSASSGGSTGTVGNTAITLKYGDTGSEVSYMQNALIALNYLTGTVTLGTYDTNTQTAVRRFQQAFSLTVDGVAGPATLAKIYQVAGVSSGNSGSTTTPPSNGSVGYSLGNVELVNWFTGDIKTCLERSASKVTIVSVETKQGFNAKYRWGTQHADCEPLTASDTAIGWSIRNSSGYKDRVPVWVIAGGRTFASSMYFWEHDTSSDTIKDNNYAGVFCLHFQGSTTHTNQNANAQVNLDHQKSVLIAYNAAH